jgi:hypothetical protein
MAYPAPNTFTGLIQIAIDSLSTPDAHTEILVELAVQNERLF